MNHSPTQCQRIVADLCPTWARSKIRDWVFLEAGYSNSSYRFSYHEHTYVLRIAATRNKPLQIDRKQEKQILRRSIYGVTPDLIAYDELSGNMITRYLAGQRCIDLRPTLDMLTKYLISLHQSLSLLKLPVYQLDDIVRSNLQRARECGFSVPVAIARRAADFSFQPQHCTNCHNDLNPWNIICGTTSPDGWRTLDWEYAGTNDPLFDIICLSRGLSFSANEEHELIQKISPCSSRQRIEHVIEGYLLREYSWAALQHATGNRRDVILQQLNYAERDLTDMPG